MSSRNVNILFRIIGVALIIVLIAHNDFTSHHHHWFVLGNSRYHHHHNNHHHIDDKYSYSKGGARFRFEKKFNETCLKYSFVDRYLHNILNPSGDYIIFVFHENGRHNHGGLGDRLAGMITSSAFAIRSGRTLLIQGDKAFEDSFRPYYPSRYYHSVTNLTSEYENDSSSSLLSSSTSSPSWKSWEWAGWKDHYSNNMSKLNCINPIPDNTVCALDKIRKYRRYKVIKYYGNRVYLCRWVDHPDLKHVLSSELAKTLDINQTNGLVNLYEIAGCLLRLAIWPTEKLWTALDETMNHQFIDHDDASTSMQVGFHFRCGDSSFSTESNNPVAPISINEGLGSSKSGISSKSVVKHNPECFYDPEVPWKGTSFSDDKAMDSPVDSANCGRLLLTELMNRSRHYSRHDIDDGGEHHSNHNSSYHHSQDILAYIASDNKDSSNQINDTLRWDYTVKPPQSCHMDIQRNHHCTLTTSLHWFMLSLSDVIITQALIKPAASVYDDVETKYSEAAPVSAFSRYAAIYSLSDKAIRYGRGCQTANQTLLSYESHGNWVCNPKMFY
jgi:hypothetical protein